MNANRTFTLCLVALASMTAFAQKDDAKLLATSRSTIFYPISKVNIDNQTQERTVIWSNTEDWNDNSATVWAENVPEATFLSNDFAGMNREKNNRMAGMGWELTEEGDNTVLHCYMSMPADAVKNFWLASDETSIVDLKTGINYRAQRSVPDCWGKYFAVKAKEGTVLDFQIFFPKLPLSTTNIAIYGVPNWFLRGKALTIKRIRPGKKKYDKSPDFKQPKMVSKEKDYDKNNGHSWEVYTEPHIIKPTPEGTMAIWRTAEATYLAVAHEQNWMREYFYIHPGTILADESGHMYKLKEVKGLPSNNHIFWMEGYSGDHIVFLYVFEPIPLDVNTISFLEPDSEPFNAWGANWKGDSKYGLDINELRENQKLFKYNKRKVVK